MAQDQHGICCWHFLLLHQEMKPRLRLNSGIVALVSSMDSNPLTSLGKTKGRGWTSRRPHDSGKHTTFAGQELQLELVGRAEPSRRAGRTGSASEGHRAASLPTRPASASHYRDNPEGSQSGGRRSTLQWKQNILGSGKTQRSKPEGQIMTP